MADLVDQNIAHRTQLAGIARLAQDARRTDSRCHLYKRGN
jgi:hypothetical protein